VSGIWPAVIEMKRVTVPTVRKWLYGCGGVAKAEDLVQLKKLKTIPNFIEMIPNLLKSNQMLVFCDLLCVWFAVGDKI
jgi:hypothetical protein